MHRLAGILGIVGGLAWISLGWWPPECTPVTGASEVLCNRLWTAPLGAMFLSGILSTSVVRARLGRLSRISFMAVTIGFGAAAAGNGLEYWLADGLPHTGPDGWIRGVLWMTVLAGWVAMLLGSFALGIGLLRDRSASPLVAAPFLLTIPLTVALGVIASPALGVGVVGIAVGILGLVVHRDRSDVPVRAEALA